MDLSTELNSLVFGNKDIDEIFKIISIQQEELKKKAHILWVVSIGQVVDELLENKVFEKHGITEINIFDELNVFRSRHNLTVKVYDDCGRQTFPPLHPDDLGNFKELLRKLDFNQDHVSDKVGPNGIFIPINESFKNNIMSFLLSPEMQKILEYNQMQIDIPNEQNKIKKHKL